ncbi:MAG: hypothetical protein K5838_05715 [Elusimicrobiales bacterium]|nr:hypothetical protein [Elusimicrobiales bacterium]
MPEDMEPGKSGGFWDRIKANRYAFESVLFEHKAINVKDKTWAGVLGAILIWGVSVIFLFEWIKGRGPLLGQEEAQTFSAVLHYFSALGDNSFWTFIKPDFNSLRYSPPLYYLLYVPVLKFITSDLNMAMLFVNSIFLLVLSIMPFFAVSPKRGWIGGLLASAAVMSCPFITEAARMPSASIAVIALVAGFYCSFMAYTELADNKWSYAFALFFVLGLYTSGTFWIYTIPLWQAMLTGTTNNVNGARFFKVLLAGFLVNASWYLCFIILLMAGIIPLRGQYEGAMALIKGAVPSLGLPLLFMGGIFLAWMYFNTYKPYEKRKDLMRMFWVPWAVFTFGICAHDPSVLYPALIALPLSIAIMVPYRLEKILVSCFIVLFLANNLASPVNISGIRLLGTARSSVSSMPYEQIMETVRAHLPQGKAKIGVYSKDGSINAESFSFAFKKINPKLIFLNDPMMPDFSALVINKTEADGSNSAAFDKLRSEEGFQYLFIKQGEIRCQDGSKVEIYSKNNKPFGTFPAGRYPIGTLTFGKFTARKVILGIEQHDPVSESYKGYIFAPSASLYGGDIYGLRLDVSGLKFSDVNSSPALSDIDSARITSSRLSSYTVESVLRQELPFLEEISVSMDNDKLTIGGNVKGHSIVINFGVSIPKDGIIEIRPLAFSFMGVNFPEGMQFLLKIFAYRINLSENPYGLSAGSISMSSGIMEIK